MPDDANAIHNERIKGTATLINNVATAFIVLGFVTPELNGQMTTAGRFLLGLVSIVVGAGLHGLALGVYGRMK